MTGTELSRTFCLFHPLVRRLLSTSFFSVIRRRRYNAVCFCVRDFDSFT